MPSQWNQLKNALFIVNYVIYRKKNCCSRPKFSKTHKTGQKVTVEVLRISIKNSAVDPNFSV
jgi:hypothetical protein